MKSYSVALAERLEYAPPKRKGDRTRERLKLAAARVLEQVGYHAMRVTDITAGADASEGTFYIYYKDKDEVTRAVLHEFLSSIQENDQRPMKGDCPLFLPIMDANLQWIRTVRANAGLMRSVFQMMDNDAEFGRIVHQYNRQWYEKIAQSVVRNHDGQATEAAAYFAACALGAMMDELMRRIVIYPDERFVQFLAAQTPDDESLAQALSLIWLRVLYPDSAPPADLSRMARLLGALG
ncbi:TetR/AcrR family transcriptional regulator [Pacificimonas sp. WHA3]|uniref:TetR/AcrR family transcriptional regulator n=1 Tax=Pacificimonas pallii TaxID=2827236 RepID=A0ABS6SAB1_9SPHN|nr:TetR/AcrR family transcriptional regulator [Pacificimonas pallii]MBV7255320.1 TetR/AcrR family transcriptional regulator [Pacificimonas pallii]